MTAELATFEKVTQAVEQLRRTGEKITSKRILDLVGGSKPTILKHMRALRSENFAAAASGGGAPAFLVELAKPMLLQLMAAASTSEAQKFESLTQRYHEQMESLEAEVEEFGRIETALRQDNSDLTEKLTQADVEIALLKQQLATLAHEQDALRHRAEAAESDLFHTQSRYASLQDAIATTGNLENRLERLVADRFKTLEDKIRPVPQKPNVPNGSYPPKATTEPPAS
jgi:DNA repair exonuclease SbcCD ATPase subunit